LFSSDINTDIQLIIYNYVKLQYAELCSIKLKFLDMYTIIKILFEVQDSNDSKWHFSDIGFSLWFTAITVNFNFDSRRNFNFIIPLGISVS